MPCTQPNLDWYKEQSEAAFAEIMELLRTKYYITPLDTCTFYNSGFFRKFRDKYEQERERLREALKELFINEGCASF